MEVEILELKRVVKPLQLSKSNPCAVVSVREGDERAEDVQRLLDVIGEEYPIFSLLFSSDAKTIYHVHSPWLYCKLNHLEHLYSIISMNEAYISGKKVVKGNNDVVYLYLIDVDSFKDSIPEPIMDLILKPKLGIRVLFVTSTERREFSGLEYYKIL